MQAMSRMSVGSENFMDFDDGDWNWLSMNQPEINSDKDVLNATAEFRRAKIEIYNRNIVIVNANPFRISKHAEKHFNFLFPQNGATFDWTSIFRMKTSSQKGRHERTVKCYLVCFPLKLSPKCSAIVILPYRRRIKPYCDGILIGFVIRRNNFYHFGEIKSFVLERLFFQGKHSRGGYCQ